MRDGFVLIITIAILALSVFNMATDYLDMQEHEAFFKEMIEFKNRGGRNTAEMGFKTCIIQNIHNKEHGITDRNCCEIYFPDSLELCNILKQELK